MRKKQSVGLAMLSVLFISFPQWTAAVWSLYSKDPLFSVVARQSLGGKVTALLQWGPTVLGFAGLIYVLYKTSTNNSDENHAAASSQPTTPPIVFAPNITQTANPILTQRNSTPTTKSPLPPLFQVGRPVIEMLNPRAISIAVDSRDDWQINPNGDKNATIVPFYYDPNKSTSRPEIYVKAHVVFVDKKTGHKSIIPAAVWVAEHLNRIVFKSGDEHLLLLFVYDESKRLALKNRRESMEPYNSPSLIEIDHVEISPNGQTAEITLLWNDDKNKATYSLEIPSRPPRDELLDKL